MGNVPLRRFVELEVYEVSLVDSPANEKEFAILKRVEEEMSDDVKEVIEKEATSDDENLQEETTSKEEVEETTAVDPEKVVNEAVEKAIDKVTGLIESIAKKANEKNEEEVKEEAKEEVAEKVEEATSESAPEVPEEKAEPEDVKKAKRFTPRRIEALKEVAQTIQSLVQEIAESSESEEPVAKSVEVDETQVVFKSLMETLGELKESFQSFRETSKSLGERLDLIEKAVQPSRSVESNGGTDTEVKKDTNIWRGLL